jgi:threonine/homoserine/homoserine lactone efflux protein
MDISFLIRGTIIGFSIAAPVGPIGVLCIRRSLQNGFRTGLYTGLGAATADALYGAVAAFGLTIISMMLLRFQFWLGIGGGIFLCYLGVRGILAKPTAEPASAKDRNNLQAYLSTLFLTLTNPATILSFLAIFAGAGLSRAEHPVQAAAMVSGVFLGSAVWWLFLSFTVSVLGRRFNLKLLRGTNVLAGVIMLGFGLCIVLSALKSGNQGS